MSFHYKNTETKMHGGKRVVRSVHVSGNSGFKSVSIRHNTKTRTVKKPLSRREMGHIKKQKFIKGLFDDCYKDF
jgi:hypothetical protein